ncbi:MAG TPA: hypothetical protein VJ455_09035 [Ignavibacteria bacterium]|nr:hypothetical protein [Ignavibacteria bacterium]
MDLAVILTVLGIAATFIAPAVGYLIKLRKDYRNYYLLLWKDSASITLADLLGERPYNDYYYQREYDTQLRRLIERRRNTLIVGSPLSGKSRAVYNALKHLVKHADILATRSVAMAHFNIPPNLKFWKDKLIFIDDLQFYIEKQDNFHLLFKAARDGKIPIVATCHSGNELKKVKNKMTEQNLDIDNIFGEDVIEFEKLNTSTGKEIAVKLGMEWDNVKFNGTVGSIFMRLSEMERRYDKCDNIEKTILHVLRNMYIAGINDDNGIFNLDWLKLASKTYELEGRDFEWAGWLKLLEDKEFIKITRRNKIWAEDAYLEFIVKPLSETTNLEIYEDLTEIFASTPDALLMLGERVYDSGIIDMLIADHMRIVIKIFNLILESNSPEPLKIKAKQYLGKAYWSLAKVENTLENCRYAIGYFEDIIKTINRIEQPFEYANIKTRIGNTYMAFAEVEHKIENCRTAIKAYEEALGIFSSASNPFEFARTYNNLGGAYLILAEAEKPAENFKNAIDCFKKALEVRTVKEYPKDYALTKNNIANTYTQLSGLENPIYNLKLAVSSYEDALSIYTKQRSSLQYGMTMNNLGNAYGYLAVNENKKLNLEKAIDAYEKALEVRTFDTVPVQYSNTMANLGDAYLDLWEITNDPLLVDKAIESFHEALKVRTFEKSPLLFGKSQYLLGKAYLKLASVEDRSENYTKAIKAFDESLRVFNENNNPNMFSLIQNEITQAKKIFFM